jgi:hypothetical protein
MCRYLEKQKLASCLFEEQPTSSVSKNQLPGRRLMRKEPLEEGATVDGELGRASMVTVVDITQNSCS